jgi:sodium-dependent phosphate cotransporter
MLELAETLVLFQLDRKAIQSIALGTASPDISLLKRYCSYKNESSNGTFVQVPDAYCSFAFARVFWPDWGIGLLLLLLSIIVLCLCLLLLVKLLQSLLKGTVKSLIQRMVNADFSGAKKHLTPYLAILVSEHIFSFERKPFAECLGWMCGHDPSAK